MFHWCGEDLFAKYDREQDTGQNPRPVKLHSEFGHAC